MVHFVSDMLCQTLELLKAGLKVLQKAGVMKIVSKLEHGDINCMSLEHHDISEKVCTLNLSKAVESRLIQSSSVLILSSL
jgi:hypothetical protein